MATRLSVFFLVVFAALSECQGAKPLQNKFLGCYKGNVFRIPYHTERPNIRWKDICDAKTCDFTSIVQKCAQKALEKGNDVFAVKFYGECWTDSNRYRYTTFDHSAECYGRLKDNLVGSGSASAVYEIDKNCDGGHSDGSYWDVPQGVDKCQSCNCKVGQASCTTMRCDYSFRCEKYKPVKKGQCCPECACHHNGADKMNGEEWADRRTPGVCRQCACINGQASCEAKQCNPNCPNPEYIPGRCCPRCLPKAPTTRPWETIPTTRPRPTFPPWLRPPSHLGKKRSLRSKKRFIWKLTKQ